jgi:N-methylhydantoinase A
MATDDASHTSTGPAAAGRALHVGVDIGGTFTDAVVVDPATGQVVMAFKTPSTPRAPADAVRAALQRVSQELGVRGATVCHGTTIGTNALIERTGAPTALLATKGFADVIELRRQDRPTLYDLAVTLSEPLVEPARRVEVEERVAASGEVIAPLSGVDAVLDRIQALGVTSVAISLLHAYANPAHERALKEALRRRFPRMFVTASSEICPEYGEYERTSTTVVNSYIGPPVKDYLEELASEIRRERMHRLLIVKSNGGLTSSGNATRFPAHLIESGPAAAVIATAAYARSIGRPDTIVFDMGGTTAKAGVIAGFTPRMIPEFKADALRHGRNVGGHPIRSAVLDLVEIGAGGGSIAWIDEAGVPKVGPASAGADPGPACYGRGGERPTVTDAHAVIGTLGAETFRGTGIDFWRERAVRAVGLHVARPLGWSVEKAAHAIIGIAVANMTEMVKLATVRRGLDPRDFSVVASGGAGPLHAALVGRDIGVRETIVPPYPGMFSALGATLGRVKHDLSQSVLLPVRGLTASALGEVLAALRRRSDALLRREALADATVALEYLASCRFVGQLHELTVELGPCGSGPPEVAALERGFREAYRAEFGIDLPRSAVELVKLQITATVRPREVRSPFGESALTPRRVAPVRVQRYLRADGVPRELPVYSTHASAGLDAAGPMIIEHDGATVWVGDLDRAAIHSDACVIVTHAPADPESARG